jgi:hypothetical protein
MLKRTEGPFTTSTISCFINYDLLRAVCVHQVGGEVFGIILAKYYYKTDNCQQAKGLVADGNTKLERSNDVQLEV